MSILTIFTVVYLIPISFTIAASGLKLALWLLQQLAKHHFHFKIGKLWISSASGNCFAPALCFRNFVGFEATYRSRNWKETSIYLRPDGSMDWNSDHIATQLGEHIEGDEIRGYPDVYQYQGILGHHMYV